MNRFLHRGLAMCAGIMLCLAGCQMPLRTTSSSGKTTAGVLSADTHPTLPHPSAASPTTGPTTAPENSLTPIPPADWVPYEQPSPMPPLPGQSALEGRMLWPVSRTVWELDDYNKKEIYGFINELGELVIPVEYTGFHYGLDGQNRFRYLLACQESRTDIYTLDGKKVLSLPSGNADVIPGSELVSATLPTDSTGEPEDMQTTVMLYDIHTGEPLLPEGKYTYITSLSPYTAILLTTEEQEYLVDLRSLKEKAPVPLEGYALQNDSIRGQCLTQEDFRLMASTGPTQWYGVWEYEDMKTIRYGYLGSDGKWAIEPVYLHATAFVEKYAGVHLVSGGYRFIDRQGRFVNDEVYQHIFVSDSLESDGIAFGVTLESGQQRYLDEDLQPLETGTYANGAVYRQDHPIEGLPSNYTEIVYYEWPLVMANYYLDLSDKPSYLLNMETGEGWTLDDRYYSIQKFGGYYLADGRNGFIVFDVNGSLLTDTVFHRYPSAFDWELHMRGSPYFWVTSAQYQGYADITGRWLYRESRFGLLED